MNLFKWLTAALFPTFQYERMPLDNMNLEKNDFQDGVVIIGSGIIGLSTAYSLALDTNEATKLSEQHNNRRMPKITIVESSDRLCPAASSQATGGLGDFGLGDNKTAGKAGVGSLSYQMHVDMAAKYNGEEAYGFAQQVVYRLTPKNFEGTPSPSDDWGTDIPPVPVPLSTLPSWVKTEDDWEAQRLSSGPKGAHLDPKRFCAFLVERVKELGVEFEISANVTSVQFDDAQEGFSSVQIQRSCGSSHTVPCKTIVLAAGSWSNRVFSRLFPDAKIKIPLKATDTAGNHFRVKAPGWGPGSKADKSVQVYYTNVTPDGSNFDVTSFTNGDLYIGGWGAVPEEIPELATSIHIQPSEVEGMIAATRKFVNVNPDADLEYFDAGRCYRPTAIPNRPIITNVSLNLLTKGSRPSPSYEGRCTGKGPIVGGLLINTGHGSDGITLGLGSGKVASDLVLGRTPSIDISSLGLPDGSYL